MKKILLIAVAATLSLSAVAAPAKPWRPGGQTENAFRYAPKAKAEQNQSVGNETALARVKAVHKAGSPEVTSYQLPASSQTGYLDSPKGETWFYTVEYESTKVEHEYYTEEIISGYTITVYDASFQKLGEIKDDIEMREGEIRVAQVQVGAQVTTKFFNYDSNYELMVFISYNTAEYVNVDRTYAYTLDSSKVTTESCAVMDGYYVDAIDTATDSWSEKFWITFYTEGETETPMVGDVFNPGDMVLSTYKSAGYNGIEDPKIVTRIPLIVASGEDYVPMVSTVKDGIPYFAINRLKYSWYEDPFDYSNENPTADNSLIIDVYSTPTSWSSELEKFSTTIVPLDATLENRFFLYNGNFSYTDDFTLDRYTTDGTPAFVITKANLVGMDSYNYDFDVYKGAPRGSEAEAEYLFNIGSGTEGGIFMSDVPGFDPQVMFIKSAGGSYSMVFTNILTGEIEHTIPATGTGMSLTSATDRVAYGDSYLYVASQTHGEEQPNGDTYTFMAYFNTDGTVHHVDRINLGQLADYAAIYAAAEAFNPFIFNLDNKREYMALVKRRDSENSVSNHEELIVVSEDPTAEPIFTYVPTAETGELVTVYFANLGTDNPLLVIVTELDHKYISTAYKLPLQLFDEGDGSVENPYVITTVGGLEQLNSHPSAHFVLGCDIDAAGTVLNTRRFTFTGSLDGRGHSISNLHVSGCALISTLENVQEGGSEMNGLVCNINFIDPVFEATKDETGMLIGEMRGAVVRNVHIYGGTISSNKDVAGLVGSAYLKSRIENCSVEANITGSENSVVGGILMRTRTGSSVRACAFTGSITGGSELGGIVANMDHADDVIENCHVNAAITGKNTIGGIAGTSSHGTIRNCHVEGSLTATEEPRWGGGPKLGGIIGHLDPQAALESEDEAEMVYAAEGCYVNLSSMSFTGTIGQERYPGHSDSMHRIVGYSVVNSEPEVTGYDDDWEPIYGDSHAPEAWLRNNYAVSTLEIPSQVGAAHDSTEGQTLDPADAGMSFFSELGWPYGFDSENPWSYTGDQTHPSLYFEGGVLVLEPADTTVTEDEEFTINLICKGGSITEDDLEGFTLDMSDETVLETLDMGPIGTDAIEGVFVTFYAAKEGTCKLTFGLKGKTVEGNVTVKAKAGISEVVAEEGSPISFDGTTVRAEGCVIDVYTTMGVHALSAAGIADLSRLGQGMYIVRAVNGDGVASTLKVRVK